MVAGDRHVVLSMAVLLEQHHEVTTITPTEVKAENSILTLFRMMKLNGSLIMNSVYTQTKGLDAVEVM